MRTARRHITIINAIYPPDKGASGMVVHRLAQELVKECKVTVLTTTKKYVTDGKSNTAQEGEEHIVTIKSKGSDNGKWRRFLGGIRDSRALLNEANKINADCYIVCTDPPFMNFFAPPILKNKKWYLWTMDLFPQALVAGKIITKKNIFYKWYLKRLRNNPPKGVIYLGESQQQFLQKENSYVEVKSVVLPCGVLDYSPVREENHKESKTVLAYCGNLGEAHSAAFLLELIRTSDEKKHSFVLSLFGTHSKEFLQRVSNKKNVEVVDWINEKEMSEVDIQIVSLKSEWTHICVPSKAVSSVCYGIPILFYGSKYGDVYTRFERGLWYIGPEKMDKDIQIFWQKLDSKEILSKKVEVLRIKECLNSEWNEGVAELIKQIKK